MIDMRRYSVFWGVLLITFGGLALLSSFGLLRINMWNLMFPAFLIIWGLWVLSGMLSHSGTYHSKSESVNIPLDGAERARVRLDHRAGRLHVHSGAPEDQLVDGTFDVDVDVDVHRDNGTLEVNLSGTRDTWPRMFNAKHRYGCGRRYMWPRRSTTWNRRVRGQYGMWPGMFSPWNWGGNGSRDWNLALNGDVPFGLSVESGFNEMQLDLSELHVTDLKLQTNMSATEVRLPAKAGHTHARLRDTMSGVKIYVPEGVAARIHAPSGWDDVSVNENRFPRSGDVYQSPDYDSYEHKIEIDARSDKGTLKII